MSTLLGPGVAHNTVRDTDQPTPIKDIKPDDSTVTAS
jgi:hypothetical protein